MKRESFRTIIALIAVMFVVALGGCQMDSGSDSDPADVDNPREGIMTKETADKVFDYGDDGDEGVVINKLKSEEALKEYLATPARQQVEDRPPFIINKIDRRSVTRIAPGAFAPDPAEGVPDITLIVSGMTFPNTIVELGENLFEGAALRISVDLPAEVVDRINERYIEKVRETQDDAAAEEAAAEVETNPGVPFREILAGSAVEIRQSEPGQEPETIATGPEPERPVSPPSNNNPSTPPGGGGSSPYPPTGSPAAPTTYSIGPIRGLVPAIDGTPVTIINGTGYTGRVVWTPGSANGPGKFAANTSYKAVITITSAEGYSLTGVANEPVSGSVSKVNSQSGAGAEISAVFPVLADSVESLDVAIAAAKGSENPVVQLTPTFYTNANRGRQYIAVDADAANNPTPYTIKGLGKTSTALNVGILLANDNVTLQDVNIDLPSAYNDGAITEGLTFAGISITRTSGRDTPLLNPANKNVTVKDTTIAVTSGEEYAAGIYISGRGENNKISIIGNTVTVTGTDERPIDSVFISNYSPNFTITGNRLSSSNRKVGEQAFYSPATALNITIDPRDVNGSTPKITGNTLNGSTYDFLVEILSNGNYVGIPTLFSGAFGTQASNWATSDTDTGFYKKLFDALLPQANAQGYGAFYMMLGSTVGSSGGPGQWAGEQYEITSGRVTAIDYWGPAINDGGGLGYDIDVGDVVTTAVSAGGGGLRGRINVSGSSGETWHWTWADEGTNFTEN